MQSRTTERLVKLKQLPLSFTQPLKPEKNLHTSRRTKIQSTYKEISLPNGGIFKGKCKKK